MRGMLIKDLKLMKSQSRFFIMIGVICLFLIISDTNPTFVVSYGTIVLSMFTLSTISYDESDGGTAFLFTLPVSRSCYTKEKYVFGFLCAALSWIVAVGIVSLSILVRNQRVEWAEFLFVMAVYLFLDFAFLSVTIPVQLKYGQEKGRTALLTVVGVIFVGVFAAVTIIRKFNLDIPALLRNIMDMGLAPGFVCGTILAAAAYTVSFVVSRKIIERKEL